ncbi:hypothetical protein B0T26DRAFT_428615 [Lasiosphaeria miniovina]|uniref:Uncharacterized protein n=1 Tax=Lasiosphaeria miniovina TaxID=1954250 RepID=A0AA40A644_9PEZI|nr:uncharacterized protein B0T26DRAFT_428615 [Lasiosphaeria miniovina]KAK0709915.1 hypothetical protein B0T26DRAFT_428615 [Lasiosphaeria miniovina]
MRVLAESESQLSALRVRSAALQEHNTPTLASGIRIKGNIATGGSIQINLVNHYYSREITGKDSRIDEHVEIDDVTNLISAQSSPAGLATVEGINQWRGWDVAVAGLDEDKPTVAANPATVRSMAINRTSSSADTYSKAMLRRLNRRYQRYLA